MRYILLCYCMFLYWFPVFHPAQFNNNLAEAWDVLAIGHVFHGTFIWIYVVSYLFVRLLKTHWVPCHPRESQTTCFFCSKKTVFVQLLLPKWYAVWDFPPGFYKTYVLVRMDANISISSVHVLSLTSLSPSSFCLFSVSTPLFLLLRIIWSFMYVAGGRRPASGHGLGVGLVQ